MEIPLNIWLYPIYFYFRVFNEEYKTKPTLFPKWLPVSFIICPKNITENLNKMGETGVASMRKVSRPDDRNDLIEINAAMVKQEGKRIVWIAKSSAGAKGIGF